MNPNGIVSQSEKKIVEKRMKVRIQMEVSQSQIRMEVREFAMRNLKSKVRKIEKEE